MLFVRINSGRGVDASGEVVLTTVDASKTGDSGSMLLATGSAATGNAGAVKVATGDAADGSGGSISIKAGAGVSGSGGSISVHTGASRNGEGGSLSLVAGAPEAGVLIATEAAIRSASSGDIALATGTTVTRSHVSKGSNQSVLRAHSSECYPAHAGASAPPCSGQGVCITEHGCVCDPLVYGKHCQFSVCPGVEHCNKECCGNGACDPTVSNRRSRFDSLTRPLLNAICSLQNGKCICKDGWEGPDCYFRSCPGGCSGNGACNALGQCECHGLWTGDKCQHRQCLHDCSRHGR